MNFLYGNSKLISLKNLSMRPDDYIFDGDKTALFFCAFVMLFYC